MRLWYEIIGDDCNGRVQIISSGLFTLFLLHTKNEAEEICARLNGLLMENRKLEAEIKRLEKAEILANQRGEMIGFATALIEDLGSQEIREMWKKFRENKYNEWRELD